MFKLLHISVVCLLYSPHFSLLFLSIYSLLEETICTHLHMEWILLLIFPSCLFYQHHSPGGGEMRFETFIITTRYILLLYLLRSDARQICHQSNGAMSCSHFRLRDFWKSVGVDAANKCEVVLSNTIIIKVGYYFFCLIILLLFGHCNDKYVLLKRIYLQTVNSTIYLLYQGCFNQGPNHVLHWVNLH